MSDGVEAEQRGGVVYLTIDTPRSPVNIFTPRTGARLVEELDRAAAAGARAVVLQSRKPASFINGVGLLLAASSRSEAALAEASRIRGYYEAVAASKVPVIAAIRGNCFGCGLELALACDLRIAEQAPATRFRMPEIPDYGFMPLFGGTQRLPARVGVPRALDLIAFGAHWRADQALRAGLVDVLAAPGGLQAAVLRAVRQGVQKRASRGRRTGSGLERSSARIAALPPVRRGLAREALRLARIGEPVRGMREELAAFRRTVATRGAAEAMGFFFVRQAAKARAIGTSDYGAPPGLRPVLRGDGAAHRLLARWLRPLPARGRALSFVAAGKSGSCAVTTRRGSAPEAVGARAGLAAYFPRPGAPQPPVELVGEAPREVFLLLEDAGFDPIYTAARGSFVSDRLLGALRDSSPSRLRALEFTTWALGRGRGDPILALAHVLTDALAAGELAHVAQADLLAHAVAGFPLSLGSLLRFVDQGKLPELSRRAGEKVLATALAGRRGFYLP